MKAEVGVLHEAMAGLHGEMGAVQRELDSAKTSQDKLTKGVKNGNPQEIHSVGIVVSNMDFSTQRMLLRLSTSRLGHVMYGVNGVAIDTASGCGLLQSPEDPSTYSSLMAVGLLDLIFVNVEFVYLNVVVDRNALSRCAPLHPYLLTERPAIASLGMKFYNSINPMNLLRLHGRPCTGRKSSP